MWEGKGKGRRSGAEEKRGEVEEVIKRIREIDNLVDGLRVADFAKEGGYADKIAKELKELNPTQLRRFFDAVREIENKLETGKWEDVSDKFYLLQPQLAYAVGRDVIPARFYELMKASLSKIDLGTDKEKSESFKRFTQFLEAIVAYQKYHYPKSGAR
jgi:CRISPR-associated protein Csm2